jgi:hypothetical protein
MGNEAEHDARKVKYQELKFPEKYAADEGAMNDTLITEASLTPCWDGPPSLLFRKAFLDE